jgi:hypothetical protein
MIHKDKIHYFSQKFNFILLHFLKFLKSEIWLIRYFSIFAFSQI